MRLIFIAATALLAGCSTPAGRPIHPSPYEVVSIGKGSYKIVVPQYDLPYSGYCPSCDPPRLVRTVNLQLATQQLNQRARDYCAKTNKTMVVIDGTLDLGPGLALTFRCE